VPAPPALTDLRGERGHPIEHVVHTRHDIVTVKDDRRTARCTKRHVQYRSLFSGIDLLSAEHRIDTLAQAAGIRQSHEKADRLVGDAVLRIVEVQAGAYGHEALAARGVVSEQRTQVPIVHLLEVRRQRVPSW
jgi:hypothetical protein